MADSETPTPTPDVLLHTVAFSMPGMADAVEQLLSVIAGRRLVQWPVQTIVTPGAEMVKSAQGLVRVGSQYSLEHGTVLYSLNVLTMPAAVPEAPVQES